MHNQIFSTIDNWMGIDKKHRFRNRFQNIPTVIIEKYSENDKNRSEMAKCQMSFLRFTID